MSEASFIRDQMERKEWDKPPKNEAMLWPVAVPPIDLCEVSANINDVARMALIQRLICDAGEEFEVQQLRDWLNDPLRDDENSVCPACAGTVVRHSEYCPKAHQDGLKMCPREWALREIINATEHWHEGDDPKDGEHCLTNIRRLAEDALPSSNS